MTTGQGTIVIIELGLIIGILIGLIWWR